MGNANTRTRSIKLTKPRSSRSRYSQSWNPRRNIKPVKNRARLNTNSKKAVLVGLNYTGTKQQLQGCINDANRMRETLTSKFGYKDITVLTDKNINRNHKLANVLRNLINSGSNNIYFQYSGHGIQIRDYDGDEQDGKDEALYGLFNDVLTDDQINNMIRSVPVGSKMVLVIDACHSGTIADLPYQFDGNNVQQVNNKHVQGDIICITGCRDNQVSMDIFDGNVAYGAMSNALQRTLKAMPKGTTWRGLISQLRDNLKRDKYAQVPQLCVSNPKMIDQIVEF